MTPMADPVVNPVLMGDPVVNPVPMADPVADPVVNPVPMADPVVNPAVLALSQLHLHLLAHTVLKQMRMESGFSLT